MKRYFIFHVIFFFISPLSSYAHNQEDDTKALREIMETIRINGSEVIVGNEDMICYSKKYIFTPDGWISVPNTPPNRIKIAKEDFEEMLVIYGGKKYRIIFYRNNDRLTVLVGKGKRGKSYLRSFVIGKGE